MKLRFIVLFSLVLSCMLVTNVSYAWTLNDFFDYADQIKADTTAPTTLRQLATNVINQQSRITTLYNQNGNNATTIVCNVSQYNLNKNLDCFIIYLSNSTNYNITFNSSGAYLSTDIGRIIKDSSSSARWSSGSSSGRELNGLCFGLCETTNTLNSNYYFNNKYVPPYTGPVFTPANNGTITVYNSLGVSDQFNRLPFYPNGQNDWTLGYITDYDEVYAINGYFGPFTQSDSSGNIIDLSLNNFNYNFYLGTQNSGLCFDSSTGRVYITKDRLLNKQGYGLYLNYQASIDSNNADDFYEGNYYSYYGYINISSGDLISTDLPNYADINGFINSFGEFWKSDPADLENYNRDLNEALQPKGLFASGDLFSGELLGNLGYDDSPLRSDYSLFVIRVYRQFISAMRSDNINSSVSFTIHDHTYTYYASDFAVPDSSLKTFVRNFLIAGIFILIIYQIHFIFITIVTFDIFGLARSFDQKHTIFM